jgi:hypothetical protein
MYLDINCPGVGTQRARIKEEFVHDHMFSWYGAGRRSPGAGPFGGAGRPVGLVTGSVALRLEPIEAGSGTWSSARWLSARATVRGDSGHRGAKRGRISAEPGVIYPTFTCSRARPQTRPGGTQGVHNHGRGGATSRSTATRWPIHRFPEESWNRYARISPT